jgi:hypothetical protein
MADLDSAIKKIKNIFKRELAVVWLFSIFLGIALVVLSSKNKLPLATGDFVFVSLLTFLVSLYRPRWIFFLFISLIPLESIILVSGFLPIQLRPYQFLGGILLIAMAILYASKKLKMNILRPTWIDWVVFSLVPFSLLALLNDPGKSIGLKNILILFSFIVLFFLIRNFARRKNDLIKTAFFFTSSFIVVTTFGVFQVFADKFGWNSFEAMFGRPNSTFAEPDWLGIFLCFALAVFLSLIFLFLRSKENFLIPRIYILLSMSLLIFTDISLIILTLSRSAWVGAAVILIFFAFLFIFEKKSGLEIRKEGLKYFSIILILVLVSLATVQFGKLSKFNLFDRARSTATSEQKITIACESGENIPETISSTDELAKYYCRHINLEEINYYRSQGKVIAEIYRKDPNVMTRGAIYKKSWNILSAHPILGVGFGTISQNLGSDERGTGLNESNIFLQIWAGCGILGLVVFVFIIGYLFIYSFRHVSPICPMNEFICCPVVKEDFEKTLNIFAVLGILALIIPNLFNAGIFMGIFWLGLAIFVSIQNIHSH